MTTQTTPQKSSITQRLRTNLRRSVGVTTATQLVWLNGFYGCQPSHSKLKLHQSEAKEAIFVNRLVRKIKSVQESTSFIKVHSTVALSANGHLCCHISLIEHNFATYQISSKSVKLFRKCEELTTESDKALSQ